MNKEIVKFNSDNKKFIRSFWAKPLLEYLHNTLKKKLIYVGLPDVEAFDVKEWIEFIDIVYAFQCRVYPEPSSPEQSREKVLALEKTLLNLERGQKLRTFDVFDGYIEEVMVRGYDNSPTQKEYSHDETITIYNLDFCGKVSSPIEFKDKKGNWQKAFKFNAVDKLLNFQQRIEFPKKKFIMFLTLHCSYDGKEFIDFINNPPNSDIKNYLQQVSSKTKKEKAPYYVKSFVYDQLTKFFTQNYFVPDFLPTIYYEGDNRTPLLFFSIIGTQIENGSGLSSPPVSMKKLLNFPFVSKSKKNIFEANPDLLLANDFRVNFNIDALDFFQRSKTFKVFWNEK